MDKKIIDEMIAAHKDWRGKLFEFCGGSAPLDWNVNSESVRNDKVCKLGQWLESLDESEYPNLKEVKEVHRKFHEEAKRVYDMAASGQRDRANAIIASPVEAFSPLSLKLISKLRNL